MHLHSCASAIASSAQTADRLHPAKRLLDLLADPLAKRVARGTHGACVERRTARAGMILRDVRSDPQRPARGNEIAGIITLVTAQSDAPAARQAFIRHRDRCAPLGSAIGRLDLEVE